MSSETARKLFEGLKGIGEAIQAAAPGLKDLVPEVKAELSRMGTQGTMELASALFGGSAFVPYGPGQYTPAPEHAHQAENAQQLEHGQERGGMER